MRSGARRALRLIALYLGFTAVSALVLLPVAIERAIEGARFDDHLGTFPVQVSLTHNGVSTLETGILGKVYWDRTGAAGFGASIRSTGPPLADGTLASYVSTDFLRRNAEFIDEPDTVAVAYGEELRSQVVDHVVRYEAVASLLGGAFLLAVFRGRAPAVPRRVRRRWSCAGVRTGYVLVATAASTGVAVAMFATWSGTDPPESSYAMPGMRGLSFSSSQAVEIARQVQPFIEKNSARIKERSETFEAAAAAGIDEQLPLHAAGLAPRDGEIVVIAEADPQGSFVATRVRKHLYQQLEDLADGALRLRTISGDVTSNGTVAERRFVEQEAEASAGIPTVAVKGDHDSDTTVEQMRDNELRVPDLDTVDVDGIKVTGAADPAFKALFGGLVQNPSGVTEEEVGRRLREATDPEDPVIVLLHQPRAALGYLGIDTISELNPALGHLTTPYDDKIPDLPPGIVNVGHLHDMAGPWVVWNTDGDTLTWTVVNQLGTSGGVEETPTFNRFSTPFSVPLKPISVQLQYVNPDSGLQTGYATIEIGTDGTVAVSDRVAVGLPGGEPQTVGDLTRTPTASAGPLPGD